MGRNSKKKKKRGGVSDGKRNRAREDQINISHRDGDDESVADESIPQFQSTLEDTEVVLGAQQVHHSGKKKHSGKNGKKSKTRSVTRDSMHDGCAYEILAEELTAMSAIFQEDFKIVAESPHTQCIINLRPHSVEFDYDNPNVLAKLVIRCLPGYPYKCPKLQVIPEQNLVKDDADRLLSILSDQANFNAREGRVMIFNLVEAAQEFLTGLMPAKQLQQLEPASGDDKKGHLLKSDDAFASEKTVFSGEPYGFFDLFGDLYGDDGSWYGDTALSHVQNDLGKDISFSRYRASIGASSEGCNDPAIVPLSSNVSDISNAILKVSLHNVSPLAFQHKSQVAFVQHTEKLDVVDEESEDESKDMIMGSSDIIRATESSGNGDSDLSLAEDASTKLFALRRERNQHCDLEQSLYSSDSEQEQESQAPQKDLIMVHLLRLVCSSKTSSYSLDELAEELCSLGILPEWAKHFATGKPLLFEKAFRRAFHQLMNCSNSHVYSLNLPFWNASVDPDIEDTTSASISRYLNDFEEIRSLGHGAFGHVVLCRNKLDGRQYAVKRIRVNDKSPSVNEKILREVTTLSRLQHQHVVRYYQAWYETSVGAVEETIMGSMSSERSICSWKRTNSSSAVQSENILFTYLYIQMEYCPRTLRQHFEDSYKDHFDKEYAWHLFRQILEGLAHIHGQNIIHRDLTPNNIFFGAVGDIKIGDFGLAKFLKVEQTDYDALTTNEMSSATMEGTGQIGTLFYTAPEIEQGWPHINEKVDMYSVGIVFFELWHPFATAMERNIVLSDLKQKQALPPTWATEFPEQASLLQKLIASSPSDRPSALQVLGDDLPPRMEDEWLNDILRAIHTVEDTYVYDRVISAIFDERGVTKAHSQQSGRGRTRADGSSFIKSIELDLHDHVSDVAREVFKQHGAKRFEIPHLRVFGDNFGYNRTAVKLLTSGGDMLELCHELRSSFVEWLVSRQKLSLKRYEISWVYRRAIGHSAPNRYLQGDFDIIGGTPALTGAETIKVAMDVITRFFHPDVCDIRLNHGHILGALFSWIGIRGEFRQSVAKLLSLMASSSPHSFNRKSRWVLVRRQLIQDLHLSETIVNKLQTVNRRLCGSADEVLARLRGTLLPDKLARDALEELSMLLSYLRWWNLERQISIDSLMTPSESYHKGYPNKVTVFLHKHSTPTRIYISKENIHGHSSESILLAVGGCYDHLVHQVWEREHKSTPPAAVGISIALEKIVHLGLPDRNETNFSVLVCSRGGGGLLEERMKLVAELWEANIKNLDTLPKIWEPLRAVLREAGRNTIFIHYASSISYQHSPGEFVPVPDPSLTEQYEYANEHDIRWLVILTESGLSQTGSVKVRNLEHKKEMEINRENLIKFLTETNSTQFKRIPISKLRV